LFDNLNAEREKEGQEKTDLIGELDEKDIEAVTDVKSDSVYPHPVSQALPQLF